MGRPSSYTPEIELEICDRISRGEPLRRICQDDHLPWDSVFRRWLIDDSPAGIHSRYARAYELGLDSMAEEIIELSDTDRPVEKIEKKVVARICSLCSRDLRWLRGNWRHSEDGSDLCLDGVAEKVVDEKTTSGDGTQRTALQIDARKWLLSKRLPKRYGDRLELAGDKDAPLTITVRRRDKEE